MKSRKEKIATEIKCPLCNRITISFFMSQIAIFFSIASGMRQGVYVEHRQKHSVNDSGVGEFNYNKADNKRPKRRSYESIIALLEHEMQ